MSQVLAIGAIILLVVAYLRVIKWKTQKIRTRRIRTQLEPKILDEIFRSKVATQGWAIIDENPLVAQSTILAGIRQQIALDIQSGQGYTSAKLSVPRYATKWGGGPTKIWTLVWRINGFLSELQRSDPSAQVEG